jgi:hypothetical protein
VSLPKPRSPDREFPELRRFLEYFYSESADDDAVLAEYRRNSLPEHVALLRAELDVLFTLGLDEDEMYALVGSYGCEYDPRAHGLLATEWLRSVRARLGEDRRRPLS